ncbi:MAG: MBL fold metallo-hydrolase [Usitatibacter sp.]
MTYTFARFHITRIQESTMPPQLRSFLGLLATAFVTCAGAAAPMSRAPAPGFHRMMLGEFEVTAISDGTVELPMNELLTNTTKAHVDKVLRGYFLESPLETSVNGYLVNTGAKLVLIDAGAGGLFGPTLGKLVANIKASGYQPEQVDEIYITHMHPDHVGGLSSDGKMNFPNAMVRADKRDSDYWLSADNLAKADAGSKGFFQGAQGALQPYVDGGKFSAFEGDTELIAGVKTHASHGHTQGHTTYMVESGGQKLVLWGDLLHVAAVQFAEPSITIKFDSDSTSALIERKRAFADAAKNGYWVAAAHLAFPGIGHLVSVSRGYSFIPANYTVPR